MTPTIRVATVVDLPWLRLLYARSFEDHPSTGYPIMDEQEMDAFVLSLYRQMTLNADRFRIFIAEDKGQIVGYVGGEITERAVGRPHHVCSVHWVYVLPEYRKTGVATAMFQAGIDWCRSLGITHVECFGMAGDDGWSRRGFTPMLVRYYVSLDQGEAIGRRGRVNGVPPTPPESPRPRRPSRRRKKREPEVIHG